MPELRCFKRSQKKRQDFSSYSSLVQLDDNKANTSNTGDTEGESETWFWHKSANKSDYDCEEEGHSDVKKPNLKKEQPSHEWSTH